MKVTSTINACAILSLFILFGCGGSNKGSKAEEVEFSASKEKLVADIDKIIEDLPNPSEVPYTLQAAAADYNEDLINDLSKVSQYQNDEDKAALNLGIYSTDMGYLISYEQVQKSMQYLEGCQKLSETVGISSIFNSQMINEFQESQGSKETLSRLIDQSIEKAGKTLDDADRLNIGALILSGTFIEGVYLAVKVIETYPTDVLDEDNRNLILEPLVKIVLEQEEPLNDILALLNDVPGDEAINKLKSDFGSLKAIYEGELSEIEQKIAENTGNFMLTQDMLQSVNNEVTRIRTDIVQ